MKKLITAALSLAFAFALTTGAVAAEEKKAKKGDKAKKEQAAKKGDKKTAKKERSVKGELICAHCELGEGASCANALRVTRKGKDGKEQTRIFLLQGDAATALGKGKGQTVTAKGMIKREGKGKEAKMILVASSLKAAK